jgi:hypothetical protein
MTSGEFVYLVLALGAFTIFATTLFAVSTVESRGRGD